MFRRLSLPLFALPFLTAPAAGEIFPDFDAHQSTWNATHIIVTEGGKVVESWKGDLKPSDPLPEGVAQFTKMPVPGPDPWAKRLGEPAPAVSGKRMVLFLAYAVPWNADDKKSVWMGAKWRTYPFNSVCAAADVVWIEGDQVYSVFQPMNPGPHALIKGGSVTALKQRVDLGRAVRAQFDAARAEPDLARRVERLAAVLPVAGAYVPYDGRSDSFTEFGKCGKAAIPYLAQLASMPRGEYWDDALSTLARMGDVAFDAVSKVLDAEVAYWKSVADGRSPVEWTDPRYVPNAHVMRRPQHLLSLLRAARAMDLSARNKEGLRNHAALKELDKVLAKPGVKPEKSLMGEAHETLRAILAGKSRNDE